MSYILDALKKSEQQREAGAVPVLGSAPRVATDRRRLWLGTLVSLAAAALTAAAWLAAPRWLDEAGTVLRIPALSGGGEAAPSAPAAGAQSATVESGQPAAGAPAAQPAPVRPAGAGSAADTETSDSALQARLENLSVDVVSYSETPERRFAMIDQRIVRESDTVGNGFVVKRIVPEGVILEAGSREILLEPQ